MTSIRPPRSRFVVLFAIAFLGPILYWSKCGSLQIDLVSLGLAIDVLGAIILASPDVPQFRRYLVSGKLESAKQRLSPGWGFRNLSSPTLDDEHIFSSSSSVGFSELQDLLARRESDADIRWTDAIAFTIQEEGSILRRQVMKVVYDGNEEMDELLWEKVVYDIDEGIRVIDGRMRRTGVAVLIIGFGIQLLGYL